MKFSILFHLTALLSFANIYVVAQSLTEMPFSILVKFNEASDYQSLINNHKRQFGNRSDINVIAPRKSIYKFTFETQDELQAAKDLLEQDARVELVQYNYKLKRRGGNITPNDPLFGQQWNLNKIGLTNLWERTTGGQTPCGDTIVIAVFDYGFDQDHEDLQNLIWTNKGEIPNNNFDDDQNGYKDDYAGLNLTPAMINTVSIQSITAPR
ncbi:MAG: hypothetical protein IPL46_23990 [Saprospiraceae bacterium]|nr:hypothetical protein [Saprospiraceae bacterium]